MADGDADQVVNAYEARHDPDSLEEHLAALRASGATLADGVKATKA